MCMHTCGEIGANMFTQDWTTELGIKYVLLTKPGKASNAVSALNQEAGCLLLENYEGTLPGPQIHEGQIALHKRALQWYHWPHDPGWPRKCWRSQEVCRQARWEAGSQEKVGQEVSTGESVLGSSPFFLPSVLSPPTLSLSYLNYGSGLGGGEAQESGFLNKVGREKEDKEEEGEEWNSRWERASCAGSSVRFSCLTHDWHIQGRSRWESDTQDGEQLVPWMQDLFDPWKTEWHTRKMRALPVMEKSASYLRYWLYRCRLPQMADVTLQIYMAGHQWILPEAKACKWPNQTITTAHGSQRMFPIFWALGSR